jgi:hypothetical protein
MTGMPAALRGRFGIHVMDVLLRHVGQHAEPDDVQHCEDACGGAIDDAVAEILEVAPA